MRRGSEVVLDSRRRRGQPHQSVAYRVSVFAGQLLVVAAAVGLFFVVQSRLFPAEVGDADSAAPVEAQSETMLPRDIPVDDSSHASIMCVACLSALCLSVSLPACLRVCLLCSLEL